MFSPDKTRNPIVLPPHNNEPIRILPTIAEYKKMKKDRVLRKIEKGQENLRRLNSKKKKSKQFKQKTNLKGINDSLALNKEFESFIRGL